MLVYDLQSNKKILDAPVTESASIEQELSKCDTLKLSWVSDTKKILPVFSSVNHGTKTYTLLDSYIPNEDERGFRYEVTFTELTSGILSRTPFLYQTKDQDGYDIEQQDWPFEGLTTDALQYVCDALSRYVGRKFTFTLCGVVDSSVSFQVSSNDVLSVLSSIAQACKDNPCEWELDYDNSVLYFGQISINLGEEVPVLKMHDNISKVNVSESREPFYSCFYPQGSTKNMSRKALVGTGNVATLLRLGLDKTKYPSGRIYVDAEGNISNSSTNNRQLTLALVFDDVYPHINLYAYNIRKRVRLLKNEQTKEVEKDAEGKNRTYTIWYMRLAYCSTSIQEGKKLINTTHDIDENGREVTHYWYDYELDRKKQVLQGHTLKGTFKVNTHATNNKYDALSQSLVGQPNGQDGFEMYYHEADNDIPARSEIGDSGVSVRKGDYEIVKYQSGDTIIPTNEENGLIPRGKELPDLTCNIVVLFNIVMGENETRIAQEELASRTIKEIKRRSQDNNNYTLSSNPVAFAQNNPNLYVGQKVCYDDGHGYRLNTRVIKLVTKVDYPIIQEITLGNQAIKGTISQLKEDVRNILSGNFSGGGLNSSQISNIVKNYCNRFLRKDVQDTAEERITMADGVQFGKEFNTGFAGKGGVIDGDGRAELRSLRLWETLEVPELRYNRVSIYTGIRWDTFGGGIIERVNENSCTLKLEKGEVGAIKEGDLCMGIWHDELGDNATDTSDSRTGNFSFKGFKTVYFRIDEIPATDAQGQDNSDFHYFRYQLREGHNIKPFVGMHFAGRGNISDKERQSFVYTTTEYALMLTGVNTWEWGADNIVSITGKLDGFSMKTASGEIKQFNGYGQVFGNAYMYGHIDQFDRAAERIEWSTDNGEAIAEGEQTTITLKAIKGFDEVQAVWSISHGSFAASASSFVVRYSDLDSNAVTTLFEVRATLKTGNVIQALIPIKRLVNGKDAVTVVVTSDRGTTFHNGFGETTLRAYVYRGGEDITNTVDSSRFSWRRTSSKTLHDDAWNMAHEGFGKSVIITSADVEQQANFECLVNL